MSLVRFLRLWPFLALLVAAAALLIRPAAPARAQFRATLTPTPNPVLILTPVSGDIVQGSVAIIVQSDVPGFRSAELSFSYAGDPTGTWFLLAESNSPARGSAMLTWDTSTITDGEYDLRLQVFFQDAPPRQFLVTGLRVRNYTAVETLTPAPSPTFDPGQPTLTPTPTVSPPAPTPTPLPTNPAIPGPQRTLASLSLGGLLTAALFGALGLYLAWRAAQRR